MTTFTDQVTVITAAWLNAVDAVTTDAAITALTSVTPAADQVPYYTGASTASLTALTATGRSIIGAASAAAARTVLGVQASDPELDAIAALVSAADKLPYFTGAGTAALADLTGAARTFIALGTTAAMLANLGGAGLASPAFTGVPTAPTAAVDTNTTQLATTAFVIGQAYAKLASPTFTGTPAAPTAAVDTNTTQIATTAFVIGQAYAKLASPTFTGTPAAPTAAADTNTTQIATTAYVIGQGYAKLSGATFTGAIAMSNKKISGILAACFNGTYDAGTVTTTCTIDFAANGQYQKVLLTSGSTPCVFTFTAPTGPGVYHLEIKQPAAGSTVTMTLPAGKWPGDYSAAQKLLSTTLGAVDELIAKYTGTEWRYMLVKAWA